MIRIFLLFVALAACQLRAELINVALIPNGGFAQGSSVIGTFPNPWEVNDGNRFGLASTALETNPWWQVTFDDTYYISVLNLFYDNRSCCLDRMNTFAAYLYNTNGEIVWSSLGNSVSPDPNDSFVAFNGINVSARSVRFQLETFNHFGIREIEAFSDLPVSSSDVPEPATFIVVALSLIALWVKGQFRRTASLDDKINLSPPTRSFQ